MPKKIVTGKNKVLNKKENIQEKSKKTEETQEISPEKKKKRTEKAVITFFNYFRSNSGFAGCYLSYFFLHEIFQIHV